MAEHYTRRTVSVSKYCSKCQKATQHRVDAGRVGPCLDCIERFDKERTAPKKPPAAVQERLFS